MDVLNVNHTLDLARGGGTAERTFQLSRHLARRGIGCALLVTDAGAGAQRAALLERVEVSVVPLIGERYFVPRLSYSLLRRLVARADVIHLMGHWTILNAAVYLVARRLGKPYVVCPAGALPIYGRSRVWKRLYNLIVGKRMVRQASACIAITSAEIAQIEAYGVPRERVNVIPNGISAEDFANPDPHAFRARFGLGAAPFVLFMGRLDHIKGPDLLLRAFVRIHERFPDLHLVYAGPDSGMLRELEETARSHMLDGRVHFIGAVGAAERSSAYRAASLLAIPSRQEAMSLVVLEAGICGTPVLLTDRCGFDEVHERGGWVVPATEHALAEGLTRLLERPEALPAMGEALRTFAREHYQWDAIVQRYVSLYNTLVADSASGCRRRPETF